MTRQASRIVVLATGEIAIPSFRWLIGEGHRPLALVTQPDRPAGRSRALRPPPIKEVALAQGIEILQPERVREAEALERLEALEPDLIVVMAYGQILPQRLIDIPAKACVNLHASLLPKYRGAACIQAAIDAGDPVTGVTLMHVVKQLDAGDVILREETPIGPGDTAGDLHDRLAEVAVDALRRGLPGLLDGSAPRTPQAELGESSHVPKLGREDGRIDWSWPASRLERRIRAYDPWPGTWTSFPLSGAARRLKVFPARRTAAEAIPPGELRELEGELHVGCGAGGSLVLDMVQPDGARRMPAAAWWRGLATPVGLD